MNEFWVMDVLNRNDEPIIIGVKVVVNWNLLTQYSMDGKPLGDLVCQSISGGNNRIRRFDMGQVDEIVYYVENELAQVLASINESAIDEV